MGAHDGDFRNAPVEQSITIIDYAHQHEIGLNPTQLIAMRGRVKKYWGGSIQRLDMQVH